MTKAYSVLLILIFAFFYTESFSQVQVTTKYITKSDPVKRYKVSVEYPQLQYSGGRQEIVNQRIENYVTGLSDSFLNDMKDWDNPPDTSFSSEFEIGYNVVYSGNDIVSIMLGNYSYYAGAAHPNTMTYALNYDLKTGDPIQLNDVFLPNSDYLNVLSKYAQEDLIRQGEETDIEADMWWFDQGASPKEDNFKVFNLAADSLVITFNPYQVAPYAAGMWEVRIPYKVISAVLNREGIMGRFSY